jgi:hypothetical protein
MASRDMYDIVCKRVPEDAGWIVLVAGKTQIIRADLCNNNVGR